MALVLACTTSCWSDHVGRQARVGRQVLARRVQATSIETRSLSMTRCRETPQRHRSVSENIASVGVPPFCAEPKRFHIDQAGISRCFDPEVVLVLGPSAPHQQQASAIGWWFWTWQRARLLSAPHEHCATRGHCRLQVSHGVV